jgi:hypothetical protein
MDTDKNRPVKTLWADGPPPVDIRLSIFRLREASRAIACRNSACVSDPTRRGIARCGTFGTGLNRFYKTNPNLGWLALRAVEWGH